MIFLIIKHTNINKWCLNVTYYLYSSGIKTTGYQWFLLIVFDLQFLCCLGSQHLSEQFKQENNKNVNQFHLIQRIIGPSFIAMALSIRSLFNYHGFFFDFHSLTILNQAIKAFVIRTITQKKIHWKVSTLAYNYFTVNR